MLRLRPGQRQADIVTEGLAPLGSGRLEIDLVDEAPDPVLSLLEGLDDGVVRGLKVTARVPVGWLVAAADVSAGPTQAQVNPAAAGLEAFLAAVGAGRHLAQGVEMGAGRLRVGHAETLTDRSSDPRTIFTASPPSVHAASAPNRSSAPVTGLPPASTMRSPSAIPAFSAGEPSSTSRTSSPSRSGRPTARWRCRATCEGASPTPSRRRCGSSPRLSASTLAFSAGSAAIAG